MSTTQTISASGYVSASRSSVPPQPISMSSACAPIASTRSAPSAASSFKRSPSITPASGPVALRLCLHCAPSASTEHARSRATRRGLPSPSACPSAPRNPRRDTRPACPPQSVAGTAPRRDPRPLHVVEDLAAKDEVAGVQSRVRLGHVMQIGTLSSVSNATTWKL